VVPPAPAATECEQCQESDSETGERLATSSQARRPAGQEEFVSPCFLLAAHKSS
jgi:hypothetical protein